jgi:hypothetical protein
MGGRLAAFEATHPALPAECCTSVHQITLQNARGAIGQQMPAITDNRPNRSEAGCKTRSSHFNLAAAAAAVFAFVFAYALESSKPDDAINHVGEDAVVCGVVASAKYATSTRRQPTFLNLDKPNLHTHIHSHPGCFFTATPVPPLPRISLARIGAVSLSSIATRATALQSPSMAHEELTVYVQALEERTAKLAGSLVVLLEAIDEGTEKETVRSGH